MKSKIWNLINSKGIFYSPLFFDFFFILFLLFIHRNFVNFELGHIYICGDAKAMAKDVSKLLTQIIHEEGNMTLKEAEKFLDKYQFLSLISFSLFLIVFYVFF